MVDCLQCARVIWYILSIYSSCIFLYIVVYFEVWLIACPMCMSNMVYIKYIFFLYISVYCSNTYFEVWLIACPMCMSNMVYIKYILSIYSSCIFLYIVVYFEVWLIACPMCMSNMVYIKYIFFLYISVYCSNTYFEVWLIACPMCMSNNGIY